jgi:outer membrane lipoprotein-sorting protein
MSVAKISVNKLFILSGLILALLFSAACNAENFTIVQLMQTLEKAKPSHATFIETKHIALLDQPVVSSGELFFTAPDHLEKRTLLPKPESLIVDGNKILIERGSKTYYFTLQNMPELGAFINSIRGTLAGDLNALKRSFQLSLEGNAKQWTLQLAPTNEKMQKILQHIRIAGLNNQIHSIEIFQTDGDSSLMAIKPMDSKQ